MKQALQVFGLFAALLSGVSCTAAHAEESEELADDNASGEETAQAEEALSYGLRLPFPGGTAYTITQGPHSSFSHVPPYNQHAIDFAMPHGHRVVASGAGRVVYSGWFANEIRVIIDHGGNSCSLYTHLSSATLPVGTHVRRGQQIGLSGSTGASAPHLHWGMLFCNDWRSKTILHSDELGKNYRAGTVARSQNYL